MSDVTNEYEPTERSVVIVGNLSDGFRVVGPFEDHDAAAMWCERIEYAEQTWVATLHRATAPECHVCNGSGDSGGKACGWCGGSGREPAPVPGQVSPGGEDA